MDFSAQPQSLLRFRSSLLELPDHADSPIDESHAGDVSVCVRGRRGASATVLKMTRRTARDDDPDESVWTEG
jgi:hypothetical protein